ncbi:peroxisomal membrane protein PEX16 [Pisolithus orientalis]|uniref:peroxisomal membrane protein PEX16 n=1 Tax=Pisolithus orientalis TaxID=936130 RepID=UPI0022255E21|nr:peroxisomal membrane protein PEX16 [Pisolithus orientalis]KAI6008219.1 peroxisomal membrane protein PEX16 [Pisolithus orientalis]
MSSALARYEDFLVKNVSTISSVESTLKSITWLLPGRFKDAELASEALSALLNVTSLYHDTLLAKIAQNDTKRKPILPLPLHTKYTRAWCEKDRKYKWTARILELVRFTQLLVEMGMRRKFSEKNRWRGVVVIESIKVILRLVMLRITRRPLVSPAIPERYFDPASLPPSSIHSSPTLVPTTPPASPPATPDHLKNNHVPLQPSSLMLTPPPGHSDSSIEDYLLPKALTTSSVRPSLQLVAPLASIQDWLAEVIYVARPLIYVSMLSTSRHKDRALLTALGIDILSRNLRRAPSCSASVEGNEYARRDRDLVWYLFRGSAWELYTRPKLESLVEKAAHVPGLSLISAVVKDWVPLIDEYYYYTAL